MPRDSNLVQLGIASFSISRNRSPNFFLCVFLCDSASLRETIS
jgi:hypothetical protein